MSSLGMGFATYMKKQNVQMRGTDISEDLRNAGMLTQKKLSEDIKQAAFLYPSCDVNQASSAATTACSSLKIRSDITPIPAATKEDLDALTDFTLSADLSTATGSLTKATDALRLAVFNYSGTYNCKLNAKHVGANPSTTSGTSAGAERLFLERDACNGKVAVGSLFMIVQSFGTTSIRTYANVFQITALTNLGTVPGASNYETQVDALSTNNIYNQPGGLGLSGFTSEARIYPIKLVEWAVGNTGGLYRREIIPSSGDLTGKQAWSLMQSSVEGVQFGYVTASTTQSWIHNRTMAFTNDADANGVRNNNGLEDIRGVTPWFVIKSSRSAQDGKTYDNPLTASVEADAFARKDFKFFVEVRNFSN